MSQKNFTINTGLDIVNGGNVTGVTNLTASGNITANYFVGNGSQLTGISGSANTGNIGFNGDTIYDLNGVIIENSDLSHGATAAVILPVNGDTDPIQVNNTYGNVILQAGDTAVLTGSWTFNNQGTIVAPYPNANTFPLTLSSAYYVPSGGKPVLNLTGSPWQFTGSFEYSPNGEVTIQLDNIFPKLTNPGYDSGDTFEFGASVTGVGGYTLSLTLSSVAQAGPAGWTANPQVSQPFAYPSTVESSGAVKLTSDGNSWVFGTNGVLTVPLQPSGPSNEIKYGMGNLVSYLDGGWVIGEYNGTDYGTEGVRISPGIEGSAEVNIPSNDTANVNSLSVNNYAGNVVVTSGNNVTNWSWKFDNTGNLVLPDSVGTSINYANGQPYGGSGSSGNTGNVTFSDQIVIGTGDSYGGGGLYLAPGNTEIGNLQYLRVRGGDYPTHIHFDTGDNTYYDQYLGDDYKFVKLNAGEFGNITIGTQSPGPNWRWTFDNVGDTTVPGNIKTVTTGFSFTSNIANIDLSSPPAVYVELVDSEFGGESTGQVTISGVVGTTEANNTWYFEAVEVNFIQLYYDEALQNPVDGTGWTAYVGGGLAVAPGYSNLNITGGNVSITTNPTGLSQVGNVWTFTDSGGTVFPMLNTQRGDNPSGTITGQTLLFGDATQEAIISTPDGNPTDGINSQRLVINPGKGEDSSGGEGGDIYLWAGRGGNNNGSGGDVKIRGGQGMGESGSGGYLRIEAGESQDRGTPGYIDIRGGDSANTYGGYVQVTGGQGGNGQGGPVQLLGGQGATGFKGGDANIIGGASADGVGNYGNVNISAGATTWTFDNTGKLVTGGNLLLAPDSASLDAYLDIYLTSGPDIHIAANSENLILGRDSGANVLVGASGNVSIQANSGTTQVWNFDNTGTLTVPAVPWTYMPVTFTAIPVTYGATSLTFTVLPDNTIINMSVAAGAGGYGPNSVNLVIPGTIFPGGTAPANNITFNVETFESPGPVYSTQTNSTVAYVSGNPPARYDSIASAGNVGIGAGSYHWSFANNGDLILPSDGRLGYAGMGWTGLKGAITGTPVEVTSYTNAGNTSSQLFLNNNGSLVLFTSDEANANSYSWNYNSNGTLSMPPISLGESTDEQTIISSQRKIIPPFRWSAEITGSTPTVVYTATNVNTTSMKVTVQIQHQSLGMEFFEVFATFTSPDTYYTVSNRLAPPTIDASTVVVNLNGSNTMEITVTINSGAATSWVTYDAVEFGIPQD